MNHQLSLEQLASIGRLQRGSLLCGVIALAACVLGAVFQPDHFFRAYLAAYQWCLGIALGSFVVVMIYHLTGGAWGFLIQRILESGARTLPYLAVMLIPLAFGLQYLYPWARPEELAANAELRHKQDYLNVAFVLGRAALFFALWIVIALVLDFWSRRRDETGDARYGRRQTNLSGPGLILFGISITFFAVDWVMSLEPAFRSTIFGPLVATGYMLSGLAFAIIVFAWLAPQPPFAEIISPKVLTDLGSLLFTFLVVWAYMVWFQFMLIWIGNLPYEAGWYVERSQGGWQLVAYAITVLFAVAFFLLLSRDVKQHTPTVAKIACMAVAIQLIYSYYLVMPSFHDTTLVDHWMDFLTPIGLGGLWLGSFLYELQRRPILALRPEELAETIRLRTVDEEAANRPQGIQNA